MRTTWCWTTNTSNSMEHTQAEHIVKKLLNAKNVVLTCPCCTRYEARLVATFPKNDSGDIATVTLRTDATIDHVMVHSDPPGYFHVMDKELSSMILSTARRICSEEMDTMLRDIPADAWMDLTDNVE